MTHFILSPGTWLGQGSLALTDAVTPLIYYTKWTVEPMKDGVVKATQTVEIQGSSELLINQFSFSQFGECSFYVEMENEVVGKVQGEGFFDATKWKWELRGHEDFEGEEEYIVTDPLHYQLQGRYFSPNNLTNQIEGTLWKKSLS